jgi:hypothetical protein
MFAARPYGGRGINELGYRGKAPANQKGESELRLFVLGGSTVYYGGPPLAVLIEEALRDASPLKVEVFNYGVSSSVSGMEMVRIVTEIADFRPDLIFMYNGANDMYLPCYYDPRPGYPFNFLVYEQNPILRNKMADYPVWPLVAYGSNIARRVAGEYFINRFVKLNEYREAVGFGTTPWCEAIARSYVRNLEKARLVSKAFGAEFMAFFQPMAYYLEEERERFKPPDEDPEPDPVDHCLKLREMILQDVAALGPEPRSRIVDLTGAYDGYGEQAFRDVIHTHQEAKPLVAGTIADHLVRRFPWLFAVGG